jgi:putative membrane protein
MSQTSLPFWYWQQPGPFFGMPYQNFAGWLGTGAVFMTVAALLWKNNPIKFERWQLNVPLVVYLANFAFATVMSLAAGFSIPVILGFLLGVAPSLALWSKGSALSAQVEAESTINDVSVANIKVALK